MKKSPYTIKLKNYELAEIPQDEIFYFLENQKLILRSFNIKPLSRKQSSQYKTQILNQNLYQQFVKIFSKLYQLLDIDKHITQLAKNVYKFYLEQDYNGEDVFTDLCAKGPSIITPGQCRYIFEDYLMMLLKENASEKRVKFITVNESDKVVLELVEETLLFVYDLAMLCTTVFMYKLQYCLVEKTNFSFLGFFTLCEDNYQGVLHSFFSRLFREFGFPMRGCCTPISISGTSYAKFPSIHTTGFALDLWCHGYKHDQLLTFSHLFPHHKDALNIAQELKLLMIELLTEYAPYMTLEEAQKSLRCVGALINCHLSVLCEIRAVLKEDKERRCYKLVDMHFFPIFKGLSVKLYDLSKPEDAAEWLLRIITHLQELKSWRNLKKNQLNFEIDFGQELDESFGTSGELDVKSDDSKDPSYYGSSSSFIASIQSLHNQEAGSSALKPLSIRDYNVTKKPQKSNLKKGKGNVKKCVRFNKENIASYMYI